MRQLPLNPKNISTLRGLSESRRREFLRQVEDYELLANFEGQSYDKVLLEEVKGILREGGREE